MSLSFKHKIPTVKQPGACSTDEGSQAPYQNEPKSPVIHDGDIRRRAQVQTDSIRPILAFDIGLELFERGSTAARREVGRRPQLPLAAGSFKFGEPVP